MRVLTVYAYHHPLSFGHTILQHFIEGLRVDLHSIRFDPVLRDRDAPNWIDDSVPDDVLEHMDVNRALIQRRPKSATQVDGGRWIGDQDARGIVRRLRGPGAPRDVAEHQAKVAQADALAFIAPFYVVGLPAILKGWIERVFTLGFAFGLTSQGWRDDIGGRVPLLTHEEALIIQATIFDEQAYRAGLKDATTSLILLLAVPGHQAGRARVLLRRPWRR